MNFKTKTSNLTKSLYIILILCIISVICLSVYSFFTSRNNGNLNNLTHLDNVRPNNTNLGSDSDEMLRFFGTTEPKPQTMPTESVTETPSNTEENPIIGSELPQASTIPALPEQLPLPVPTPTERTVDTVESNLDYPIEIEIEIPADEADTADAVETLAFPNFFTKPLAGTVSKMYNEDTPEYSVIMNDYRTHLGIDIESEIGSNVRAVADGVVTEIFSDPMMGKTVVVAHAGGIESLYMNLLEIIPQNISVGIIVGSGDVIGGVGETSLIEISDVPHLHFAMKKDGNFIDPLEYIEY